MKFGLYRPVSNSLYPKLIYYNQNTSVKWMLYIPNRSAYRIYQKTWKKIHAMLIYQWWDITISSQNQIKIRNIIEHYDFTFDDSMKIINNQRKTSDKSNNFLKDFYINDAQDNSGALLIRKKILKT